MAKKTPDCHDLIVSGDDPAAAAAALHAARRGANVLVLASKSTAEHAAGLGWLGSAGVDFCSECGVGAKKIGAAAFTGLRLHSWDLRRGTTVADKEASGWIVDRAALNDELLKQAVKHGAKISRDGDLRGLMLAENRVVCELATGGEAVGGLLLISGEIGSPAAQSANLASVGRPSETTPCLTLEYETMSNAAGLEVAVGANRAGQIAIVLRLDKRVCLRLISRAEDSPIEEQFRNFRAQALESGLLPEGAPNNPVPGVSPGGAALDLDTHVGKRCLLIGRAGGFVTAFSHESLFPAMRSGWIAADVALNALKADVMQDELAKFGSAWRGELADYLRMPNTDLSLLVPLVFNNEQMSKRVALAFLLGRPF